MKNRILVLNVEVSGMNKYLFSELRKKGWDLTIVDVPFPKICSWLALALTFTPNISLWKKKLEIRLGKLHKTPWTFLWRTRFCERKVKELNGKFDFIFQISGMFAPYLNHERLNGNNNYAVMLSYTMALCEKYPDWAPFPSKMEKYLELEKKVYENARVIFTTNENARRSLVDDYAIPEEKIVKVGYGAALNKLPSFSKENDGKTILFNGMDFERKGGFTLLESFKKVKEAIPDARLVIVGPNKDIFKINQQGVEMLGCVRDRTTIEDLYKKASVFVMPSLCEPFGLVFLEAMAYKLPCIGSTVDAMSEIIEDGKTGFLVPPKSPEILADKIVKLLQSPAEMKEMGEAGYRKLQTDFGWERVIEKVDTNLKEAVKN